MSVDIFLKLSGIPGESKDETHPQEIHVESMSMGASQQGGFNVSGGGGAGKVNFNDITFSKYYDKATPALLLHLCNGKHIKEGLITVRKAGEKPLEYLKVKLTDLLVSAISHSAGSGGGDLLMENLSVNFSKIQMEYQEQNEEGGKQGSPIPMGWSLKENKAL